MKKLSAVQVKQQALVLNVADKIEEQGRAEIPGMLQCWFDVEYHLFPGSLLMCFQFENQQALTAAEPELLKWQKMPSAMAVLVMSFTVLHLAYWVYLVV